MAIPVHLDNNNINSEQPGRDGQISIASTTSSSTSRYVNASVATVIGTISLALIVASSFTCRFISITSSVKDLLAITSYSQQETLSSTSIGLFCKSDFYYTSGQTETKLLVGQVCASASITFGAFVVVLLWSVISGIVTCINNRVTRIWRLISLLAAICAVIQIPIFLVYQIRPCTDFQNQQYCSMDVGSYTLICSITGWIMVTIITQCLDAPTSEWYERVEQWKQSPGYENVTTNEIGGKQGRSKNTGRSKYRNFVPGFPTSHRLVRTRTGQQSLSSSSSNETSGSHISEFLLRPLRPRSNEVPPAIDDTTDSLLRLWKSAAPHIEVPPSQCVTSNSCLPPTIHDYCFKSTLQGQKETRTYSNIPFPILEGQENGMPSSPSDDYNDDEESNIVYYNGDGSFTVPDITNDRYHSSDVVTSNDTLQPQISDSQQSVNQPSDDIVDNEYEKANVEIDLATSLIGANLSRISDDMENVDVTVATPLVDDVKNYHRNRSDTAVVVTATVNDVPEGVAKQESQESQGSLGSLEPTVRSISPSESILDNDESKTKGNPILRVDSRSPSPPTIDAENFLSLSLEGMELPAELKSEILFANTIASDASTDLLLPTGDTETTDIKQQKQSYTIDNKRQFAKSWLEQRKSKRLMMKASNKGGYSALDESDSSSADDSNPKGNKTVTVPRTATTVSKPPMQIITIPMKDDVNAVEVQQDSQVGTDDINRVVSGENSGIFSRQAAGQVTGATPINPMDANDYIEEDVDPEPHLHWSDDESDDDDSIGTDLSITSEYSDTDERKQNSNSNQLDNSIRVTRKSPRESRGRRRRRRKKRSSVASVSSLISFTIEEETQDDLVDDLEPIGMDKHVSLVDRVDEIQGSSKNKQQDLNISMISDNSPATAINTSYNEESMNERSGQSSKTGSVGTRVTASSPTCSRLNYGTEFRGRILDDNLEGMTGINSRPHRVEIFSAAAYSVSSKNSKEDSSASASTPKSVKSLPTPTRKHGHRQLTRLGGGTADTVITPPRKKVIRVAQSPPVLITKYETRPVRVRVAGLRKKSITPLFVVEREVRLGLHAPGQVSSDEDDEQVNDDTNVSSQQYADTLDTHDNSSLSSGSASSSKLRILRMKKRQALEAFKVIQNRRTTGTKTKATTTTKTNEHSNTTAGDSETQKQRSLLNLVNPSSTHSSDVPSYSSSLNYSADTTTAFSMDLSASMKSSLTRYLPSHIHDEDTNVQAVLTNTRVQYDERIRVSQELTTLPTTAAATTTAATTATAIDNEGRYESSHTRTAILRDNNNDIREEEAMSSSSSASFPNATSSLYISADRSYDEEQVYSLV